MGKAVMSKENEMTTATTERITSITIATGETFTIEGKNFMKRRPNGSTEGHDGSHACAHRDLSACDECVRTIANIIEICGRHYWVRDYEEWLSTALTIAESAKKYA